MNMMFSGPTNENWSDFHSKYGNVPDHDRRSMLASAASSLGSSCRSITDAITGSEAGGAKRDSDASVSRSLSPQRGHLPRTSSARVLAVKRTASGSLSSMRGTLTRQRSATGSSLLNTGGSSHGPSRPRRSRSPMPDKRRSKSPMVVRQTSK